MVNDFEGLWDSVANNKNAKGKGNFIFGKHAMMLLEFAARLANQDKSGKALVSLSDKLFHIEPKYATRLPGLCARASSEFKLPYLKTEGDELLWALFDLIRNGLAHQYQQIITVLDDDKKWILMLTGPDYGKTLQNTSRHCHLSFYKASTADVVMRVYADILFLDFENAIMASGLLNMGLISKYLVRGQQSSTHYRFSSSGLENSLRMGDHQLL